VKFGKSLSSVFSKRFGFIVNAAVQNGTLSSVEIMGWGRILGHPLLRLVKYPVGSS